MSLVHDKNRLWKATIKIGGEDFDLQLFDTFDSGVTFGEEFMKNLKDLIIKHEHYMAGEVLTSIISPEGEDFSKYAIFLIIIQIVNEEAEKIGMDHIYLFALRKDGRVQLAGIGSPDTDKDNVMNVINLAFQNPGKLNSLILAYTPE